MAMFTDAKGLTILCAVCNSRTAEVLLSAIAPTLNLGVGEVGKLPVPSDPEVIPPAVSALVSISKEDWDSSETSWDFMQNPLIFLTERE